MESSRNVGRHSELIDPYSTLFGQRPLGHIHVCENLVYIVRNLCFPFLSNIVMTVDCRKSTFTFPKLLLLILKHAFIPGCWCHKESTDFDMPCFKVRAIKYFPNICNLLLLWEHKFSASMLCSFTRTTPPHPESRSHSNSGLNNTSTYYAWVFPLKIPNHPEPMASRGKSITLLLLAATCVFLWLARLVAFPAAWITSNHV